MLEWLDSWLSSKFRNWWFLTYYEFITNRSHNSFRLLLLVSIFRAILTAQQWAYWINEKWSIIQGGWEWSFIQVTPSRGHLQDKRHDSDRTRRRLPTLFAAQKASFWYNDLFAVSILRQISRMPMCKVSFMGNQKNYWNLHKRSNYQRSGYCPFSPCSVRLF